jgi:twitching motility protein PilT
MAVLDRYVDALLRTPGAQSLTFRPGAHVEMLVNGSPRTIGKTAAVREQIEAVLQEALPAGFLERAMSTGSHEFTYASPHGEVRVTVFATHDKLAARIVPAPERKPPPPPPAAEPLHDPGADPPTRRVSVIGKPKNMEELFHQMLDSHASDLHLKSGRPPHIRVHGDMVALEGRPNLAREELWELIEPIIPHRLRETFQAEHDIDFAHEVAGRARMRCNVFEDIGGPGAVFRQIPSKILTAKELSLPPSVIRLCEYGKGLVLVTGPTGSGKSTTLAAMIDHVNDTRREHIITIEDPVEFVHQDKQCLINQREVHTNTLSFKAALRAALREDPDVVLVGELRDLETTAIAIETAETGHLVFATLHTNTAAATVDRVINQFPADRQEQIRMMLAESLIGVISQTLCKRKGGGRIAALEVLLVTPAVSNLIREGKTFQIQSTMQTSKASECRR